MPAEGTGISPAFRCNSAGYPMNRSTSYFQPFYLRAHTPVALKLHRHLGRRAFKTPFMCFAERERAALNADTSKDGLTL